MTDIGRKRSKRMSRTERAGILFPVAKVHRLMRRKFVNYKISKAAPVYMAAVLEYLMSEICEISGQAAKDNGVKRITPRHLLLAIKNDEDVNQILSNAIIAGGGVPPNINKMLIPKKKSSVHIGPVKEVIKKAAAAVNEDRGQEPAPVAVEIQGKIETVVKKKGGAKNVKSSKSVGKTKMTKKLKKPKTPLKLKLKKPKTPRLRKPGKSVNKKRKSSRSSSAKSKKPSRKNSLKSSKPASMKDKTKKKTKKDKKVKNAKSLKNVKKVRAPKKKFSEKKSEMAPNTTIKCS